MKFDDQIFPFAQSLSGSFEMASTSGFQLLLTTLPLFVQSPCVIVETSPSVGTSDVVDR